MPFVRSRTVARSFVAVVFLTMLTAAGHATDAARIEVHPLATRDVPTPVMLRGGPSLASAGTARTVSGELRLPITSTTKVPAVIFLHGDAGAVGNQPVWIDQLNALGIAVFTVDSFSGRGVVSTSPRMGAMSGETPGAATRLYDAYAALALLAAHPRIDARRIALVGVSSGGRTTTLAAMRRFSGVLARSEARFAAYVALYPPCNVELEGDTTLDAGPLRIYIGGADDVTRADACQRYAARLRAAGADAQTTVYPGAYHGFDNPGDRLFSDPDQPSFSACRLVERDAAVVDADTGLPPNDADRCVTHGFTAGRNAAAEQAVHADVAAFLQTVLAPTR